MRWSDRNSRFVDLTAGRQRFDDLGVGEALKALGGHGGGPATGLDAADVAEAYATVAQGTNEVADRGHLVLDGEVDADAEDG